MSRFPQFDGDVEVRYVQPFQATKTYLCPGCDGDIVPGTFHVVVVPTDAPDLRRHFHRPCWEHRDTRRAGPVKKRGGPVRRRPR